MIQDIQDALDLAISVTASRRWDIENSVSDILIRSSGARSYGLSGKEYIDLTSCSGAAPLGAGYHSVMNSVIAHMRSSGGVSPQTLTMERVELAERLIRNFPPAERVIFFRTGSCATTAAVRLARIYSGRRAILTSGYHGWHDWQLQYQPTALHGRDLETIDFGYDLDIAEQHFKKLDVAAIILTPEVNVFPPAYAMAVQDMARRHGALMILDEVMTGFRYACGGYQSAEGLEPDLSTISKGLANGVALSAVMGRNDIMKAHERTCLSYTYQRETAPFVAALATLDAYDEHNILGRINRVGLEIMNGLNAIFANKDVGAWAVEHPAMFDVVFEDSRVGNEFFNELRSRGVMIRYGGRVMPSYALSSEDVALFLEAAESSMDAANARIARTGGCRGEGYLKSVTDHAVRHFGATPSAVREWATKRAGAE